MAGRSSLQQLLLFVDILLQAKQNKAEVDVIHLDIRKAFDTVPHLKLLSKLQKLGISGNLLRWFKAYLIDRSQCVSINNKNSDFLPVLSGVPQGSILGPLLFVMYINSLPEHLQHSLGLMYADDTKCIKLIHNPNDSSLLQEDIYHVTQWSISCDLDFNITKFIHMNYWNNSASSSYFINSQRITTAKQCKDLGITFTPNLSWSIHIDIIISKAYKLLGLIRRTFHTNSTITKKKLYLSLVRSQIMYCSQLWRPNLIKDIFSLERVQRRATKYILSDYSSDYKSRLITLKLLPLMYVYELNDIMFFIKSCKSPSSHFNIYDHLKFTNSSTRSSEHSKLLHTNSTSNISRHFYFCRLPRLWNALPHIDLNSSLPTIKYKLYTYFWQYFINNFNSNCVCTFHFLCPCSQCTANPRAPILRPL